MITLHAIQLFFTSLWRNILSTFKFNKIMQDLNIIFTDIDINEGPTDTVCTLTYTQNGVEGKLLTDKNTAESLNLNQPYTITWAPGVPAPASTEAVS